MLFLMMIQVQHHRLIKMLFEKYQQYHRKKPRKMINIIQNQVNDLVLQIKVIGKKKQMKIMNQNVNDLMMVYEYDNISFFQKQE